MPAPRPIAVTMGEPAGIGGEIALKAWRARRADTPVFFMIDSEARLTAVARVLGLDVPVQAIAAPEQAAKAFATALPVLEIPETRDMTASLGRLDTANAKAVIASIDKAVELVKNGTAAAMVTNPIQKASLQRAGFKFPGHTEYLGHLAGGARTVMMLTVERAKPPLRVVPVTVHEPLRAVAAKLSTESIVYCARVTAVALTADFGIARPRLAVAGLNPHAGEDGKIGDEEIRVIAPAVAALKAAGLDVSGPAPADTLFHAAARAGYDAVICMYHDQALVPLKTIDFAGGVNVTLGLPFVRTSPDHGTALDIAARGVADATSFTAALELAARLAARRGA
ncbi:MAG: 4-hydroxythreonine-4-phosphate dehydrogenase PdxA [Rhodospirillaceae bacterium]|nr:4-hydroxythreonine-4-phosphate dehydrogenase PdxA [Rhodospirillaceae bacterium]